MLVGMLLPGLLLHCVQPKSPDSDFLHEVNSGPKPWMSEDFTPDPDAFTFGIISDLNGGERSGIFSRAVTQLNGLDPDFVLSVGDLIDGGTEDTLILKKQWEAFDARAGKLNMPFFHLGGNHDLSNLKMQQFWENRYGPRYYHFLYKNVLFLILDSEDYTETRFQEMYMARDSALKIISGELPGNYEESTYYHMPERTFGALSLKQQKYFKQVLENYTNVRWTFLLMHKPLWLRTDELGLGQLEADLSGRGYTVINGHLHSLAHRERFGRDYITLGTTGGSQTPGDPRAIDHITLVRMSSTPRISHLVLDGILQLDGTLPTLDTSN